jgi:hypothetical protein
MELTYSLTPDDLEDGLRAVHVARVRRLRGSAPLFALTLLVAGFVAWPLVQPILMPGVGRAGTLVAFIVIWLGVSTGAALVWRRTKHVLVFPGLLEWAVRRRLAAALPRSVLGAISLHISSAGVWRKNQRDEITVGPAEVVRVLRTVACVVIHLRTNRILVVPTRAFQEEPGPLAFGEAVSRAVGSPIIDVAIPVRAAAT